MPTTNMLTNLPERVRIVEVGPRDGLQNESAILATEDKARFIELLAAAGFSEIEATSFVNPARVPQLADAGALFTRLQPRDALRYTALVVNEKGLDRAAAAGVQSIALFTAASNTFSQRNVGATVAESLASFRTILPKAREHGMRVRAYVSTAFVCPFEGSIAPAAVVEVVRQLTHMGVTEVSIGDTIGHAVPSEVARLTEALAPVLPLDRTAYHFHDTRGTALANVLAALQYGVAVFDSAAGGVGGCPFAPGAAGNLATEDLVNMLHCMEIETGVQLQGVVAASQFLESKLGHPLPGRYYQSVARGLEEAAAGKAE